MEVSAEVFKQFLDVRDTGRTNMLDATRVQKVAYDRDNFALVTWLEKPETSIGPLVFGDVDVVFSDETIPASERTRLDERLQQLD